jgi:hypothetical protein
MSGHRSVDPSVQLASATITDLPVYLIFGVSSRIDYEESWIQKNYEKKLVET